MMVLADAATPYNLFGMIPDGFVLLTVLLLVVLFLLVSAGGIIAIVLVRKNRKPPVEKNPKDERRDIP